MKAFLLALSAAALSSVLTLLLAPQLVSGQANTTEQSASMPSGAGAVSPGPSGLGSNADAQIAANAALAKVEELELQLTALRATVDARHARQALASSDDPAGDQKNASQLPEVDARDLILEVVAQKESDDRKARQEEREQRNAERLLEKADEIAAELGLNRTERDALHSVMVEESARRSSIFESMREGGFPDREEMRTQMQDINKWKDTELVTRFGEDMAGKIDELDGGGNPFGRGGNRGGRGGNGDGGNGGGGNGGGGNGGGGRGGGNGGGRGGL